MATDVKYSIILYSTGDPIVLAKCLNRLVRSVNPRRTEVVVVTDPDSKAPINELSNFYTTSESIEFTRCKSGKVGIGSAWNAGAIVAQGEYLLFMTDTTLVTNNFVMKLTYCMDNFTSVYKIGPVGVVAPVSNSAVRRQQITIPFSYNDDNLESVQERIQEALRNKYQGKHPWLVTGELSPFCFLVKKEIYNQIGSFDEEQLVEYGDAHDWWVRVMENNYYIVAAGDTFVHNKQERNKHIWSFEKLVRKIDYYNKRLDTQAMNLGVAYRAKIDDEYTRDIFVESLKKSLTFANKVFILDDNSKVKLNLFLKEKHPDLWSQLVYEKFARATDEQRDRIELVNLAQKEKMDWVLFLEPDEVVEDKFTKELAQKLMHSVNPDITGYNFHIYVFWGNSQTCRFDDLFGEIIDTRMIKLPKPGDREWYIESKGSPFQGKTPLVPPECVRSTSIRIKTYAFMTPEVRNTKRKLYEKIGLNKKPGTLGAQYYKTLVDSYTTILFPWKEQNTLSVYTPMKKGGDLLHDWLDHIWSFADEIVVGDDGILAVDKEMLLRWGVKVVPIKMDENYGEGRNQIIKHCTKDHILQLDLDERIQDLPMIRRLVDQPTVDCWMFSIANIQPQGESIITETARLFKNEEGVEYWGYLHETVDGSIKKFRWKVDRPVFQIQHYGYLLPSPDESFKKMQRYLEINMKQLKDFPNDPRAYYNISLHLLEDNLIDDALKLLDIAVTLSPMFPLPSIELGKTYIMKAYANLERPARGVNNKLLKQRLMGMLGTLKQIYPQHAAIAKGHALAYFVAHQDKADWLSDHCAKMQEHLEELQNKRLAQ